MKSSKIIIFCIFFLWACGGNKQGSEQYDWIELDIDASTYHFKEGLLGVKKGGRWGYIDKKGKLVIPYEFDEICNFYKGIASVKKNGLWGCINRISKEIISYQFENPQNPNAKETKLFYEGMAIKKDTSYFFGYILDYQYGYMDITGKTVIKPNYSEVSNFYDGLAWVKNSDKKWGAIDKTGTTIIPFNFAWADSFSEGLSAVTKTSFLWKGAGYIDRHGNEIIPYDFQETYSFSEGVAIARKSGKWGIVTLKNKNENNSYSEPMKKIKAKIEELKDARNELENQKEQNNIVIRDFSTEIDKFKQKLNKFRQNNPDKTTHNEVIKSTEGKYILENLAKAISYAGALERMQKPLDNYLLSLTGKIESAELDLKYVQVADASKIANLIKSIEDITAKYSKNDFVLDENKVTKISTEEVWNALRNG